MRVGQSRKRDAIEGDVIAALKDIGVDCQQLSEPGFPDLLCWHRREGLLLLEVKSRTGRLTAAQEPVHQRWPVCVVRSVAEALALFTGPRKACPERCYVCGA